MQNAKRLLQVEFGYLKELPREYAGERHIVTMGRLPNGKYQWEERPGAPHGGDDGGEVSNLLRVVFVRAKEAEQVPSKSFDQIESTEAGPQEMRQ